MSSTHRIANKLSLDKSGKLKMKDGSKVKAYLKEVVKTNAHWERYIDPKTGEIDVVLVPRDAYIDTANWAYVGQNVTG